VSARFPAFYGRARTIVVRDPLAEFLGAADGGVIEYSYLDAVKLAGHSCPTVAAAWLAVLEALQRLYPAEMPERGGVRVELRGALGFKGIAGRFVRRGLLVFGAPIQADLRLTRLDSGQWVEAELRHAPAMSPELATALRRALAPGAPREARAAFAGGWQQRVEALLA
jgi:hypothetical protein